MRATIKYEIIYSHREEYPISIMCRYFGVSKSGYYDYVKRIGRMEKDALLAEKIRQHQAHCFQTYGYRRMHIWLEQQGIHHNPKTILRVMKKYGLLAEIRRRRKWQNLGQQIHRYENLLNRQFSADRPNSKWVTDISYIQTKEGILFLSMIRDLFDNSIVAYKTAASQTVNLVLDTIRLAMRREKKKVAAELQLHSDQGFQYTSQAYFNARLYFRGGELTHHLQDKAEPLTDEDIKQFLTYVFSFSRTQKLVSDMLAIRRGEAEGTVEELVQSAMSGYGRAPFRGNDGQTS